MKKQIRLLKSWTNGDVEYPEGRLLKMAEEDAKMLIDKGIAEMYEPKAGDIIEIDEQKAPEHLELSADNMKQIANIMLKFNKENALELKKEDSFLLDGGFKSFGHFAASVFNSSNGRPDEQMKAWLSKAPLGQNEGIDSDGGFLVPTQFSNNLMSNELEDSIMYPRTMKIPMATNSIDIPVIEDASHASHVFGGVIIYRPEEGGSITSSKIKFGSVNLKLNKLAALCYVTSELLEDSPISIEPLLNKSFGQAIGFQIDDDIINGNGANQALGILNAPTTVTVAKESGQAVDTITTPNLVKMWSRLRSRSQSNAIWVANNDCFPQLSTLTQEVGTGGSAAGLIQMATNGVTGAPFMTLMGRQLFLTENCQTIGDKGDIILADMSQYLVGEKAGGQIRAASSIHLKFDSDQTAFRFIVRIDGKPWEKTALTPKYSTKTLSSFVTLAAR